MLFEECKVGDMVIGLPGSPYGITRAGWKGHITRLHYADQLISVSEYPNDSGYKVDPKYFQLVGRKKRK